MQISFASQGGSDTPVPDLSIEVDDVDAALERMTNAGFAIAYGPADDREAAARVVFGLYDGGGAVHMFEGSASGRVADLPRGDEGFGWDPIFIPDGWTRSWGEMSSDEQLQTSMRRQALQELQAYLDACSCGRSTSAT